MEELSQRAKDILSGKIKPTLNLEEKCIPFQTYFGNEMIVNGSFITGDFTGWIPVGVDWYIDTSNFSPGGNQVNAASIDSFLGDGTLQPTIPLTIVPGKTYRLSFVTYQDYPTITTTIGGNVFVSNSVLNDYVQYTFTFLATDSDSLIFSKLGGLASDFVSISLISLKEVFNLPTN